MKDVFYTLLVVWVMWRIIDSISSYKSRNSTSSTTLTGRKMDETTITNLHSVKNKLNPTEGEYVDFEEIK
ncbi:MAG: hypothetical protein ABI315_03580 [Bacteroidia bacterium]